MRPNGPALALVLALASGATAQDSPTIHLTMTDLGSFKGEETFASAINNRGEVVGVLPNSGGAFLWTRAKGYRRLPIKHPVWLTDINERGQIVGVKWNCNEDFTECIQNGFIWSATDGLRNLGPFFPTEVNNKGDMSGRCPTGNPDWQDTSYPCVYFDGTLRVLRADVFDGGATGINERGDVVGWMTLVYEGGQLRSHAFMMKRRGKLRFLQRVGGDSPETETWAYDINESGVIAGSLSDAHGHDAVIWKKGQAVRLKTVIDFPPDGAEGRALNNRGTVIGRMFWGDDPYPPPLVWDRKSGAVLPLGELFTGEFYAEDVNDRSQIVGYTYDWETGAHAILWQVRRSQ